MTAKQLITIAIVLGVAIVIYLFGSPLEYAALTLYAATEDYLVSKTSLNPDGTVTYDGVTPVSPDTLAADSNVDVEVMSLARVMESEARIVGISGMTGVGWTAKNYADLKGKTITDLVTRSTHAGDGFYGKQSQGRYCATSRDPKQDAIDLATQILNGQVSDPTGGAVQWDSPWSYADPNKADSVAASRIADGRRKFVLPDVPERKLRFWI